MVDAGQRSAGDRNQEVHWDGLRLELTEGERHVDHVVLALALPEDGAAAQVEAGTRGGRERGHSVLIRVRGADLGIEALARVEVVVELLNPGLVQLGRALLGDQPERAADGDAHFYSDSPHALAQVVHLVWRRRAPAEHDAVAAAASLFCLARTFQQAGD